MCQSTASLSALRRRTASTALFTAITVTAWLRMPCTATSVHLTVFGSPRTLLTGPTALVNAACPYWDTHAVFRLVKQQSTFSPLPSQPCRKQRFQALWDALQSCPLWRRWPRQVFRWRVQHEVRSHGKACFARFSSRFWSLKTWKKACGSDLRNVLML